MKHIDKRQLVGFLLVVIIFFLSVTLFAGCGEDSNGYRRGIDDIDVSRSAITVNPPVVMPDGESEATVTVSLFDMDMEPLGGSVYLHASLGEIVSDNPASLTSGRAEFIVRSTSSGRAVFSLPDYPNISKAEMVFGSIGSGIPAGIRVVSVHPKEIAVAGVGETENSTVKIRVLDEAGNQVKNPDFKVHASFLTRPQGWEQLSQFGDGGETGDELLMDIDDGGVWFNVKSGNVPGIIEVLLEVLHNGQSLSPPVKTVIPQISVASGKPHILTLSAPRVDAVVNLNEGPDTSWEGEIIIPETPGFYSRRAALSVLDRWGNPVPDGTVINIGVLDTVIVSGTGRITENYNLLQDTVGGVDFLRDSVVRNDMEREIQPGDRVIIRTAKAQNKIRFVHEEHPVTGNSSELYVGRPYKDTELGRNYVVGASLLGAALYGVSKDGNAMKGTVEIYNGTGQIRFVYPAKPKTIHLGHMENDERYEPGSSRVITIFSTSDDSATLVDEGTLTFSSIAPWNITAHPDQISSSSIITFQLVDGGDQVPLPYVNLVPAVSSLSGENIRVDPQPCKTGLWGTCAAEISVTGAVSGDSAEIIYHAGGSDAVVTISYEAP